MGAKTNCTKPWTTPWTTHSLAVDGDGSVARLALNPLQLIDEVDDGLGVLGGGELGPASEVELGHYARVLWLGGGGGEGGWSQPRVILCWDEV